MTSFTAILKQFGEQGEKTGWVYLLLPKKVAESLAPGIRKTFRVRGLLDHFPIHSVAVMPLGDGQFILPVNAGFRKAIKKTTGHKVKVQLEMDDPDLETPPEMQACLEDEPAAAKAFAALPKSHKHYYIRWVGSAKTAPTQAKRIAAMLDSLEKGLSFSEMIRSMQQKNRL